MASPNQVIHPPRSCALRDGEHGWVGTNGQGLYCTQTCLDIAEGRKPQKFGRDER